MSKWRLTTSSRFTAPQPLPVDSTDAAEIFVPSSSITQKHGAFTLVHGFGSALMASLTILDRLTAKQLEENITSSYDHISPNDANTSESDRDALTRVQFFGGSLSNFPESSRWKPMIGVAFPWPEKNSKVRRGVSRRAVFSDVQRQKLEDRFLEQKYISKPDRKLLAESLGLKDSQVKVWFQNRRMKWRNSKEREFLSSQHRFSTRDIPDSEVRKYLIDN